MDRQAEFRAFFSYSHQDADTDSGLVDALTKQLSKRVNVKLVNGRFDIWRDVEGIRTGDRWNPKIENVLRSSDILIVLLTPRWLGSDFCRKEYEIFEKVEEMRSYGDYVASYIVPILARKIERQEHNLTDHQRDVYVRITSRQHQAILAPNYLKLPAPRRTALIDKVADDIEGMIERRVMMPPITRIVGSSPRRSKKASAFDGRAHNFNEVDFVSNAELVLRGHDEANPGLFAQVDFVERLYVQSRLGRIDFGVKRAFLAVKNQGIGKLRKIEELKGNGNDANVSYKVLQEDPGALCVCMDARPGKSSLAELALPLTRNDKNENYLSKIATVSREVVVEDLAAELIVSLNAEGLHLAGDKTDLSLRAQGKIKAIMEAAAGKVQGANDRTVLPNGQFRRSLKVEHR
jgi:hypothetical protein